MANLRVTRDAAAPLIGDQGRVITKPFLPLEEVSSDGSTRMIAVVRRILAMPEEVVAETLDGVRQLFGDRHRDLDSILDRGFEVVAEHLGPLESPARSTSQERRRLVGAYFTHEYSVESAALTNPCIVEAPDQSGVDTGALRFVMSVRSIGEGHISSIQFRSGVISPGAGITFDPRGAYALTGERHPPQHPEPSFETELRDPEAMSEYHIAFPGSVDLSERVLFPSAAIESRGMEDARFVRFVDDDGEVTYFATYTAYDGHHIRPLLLETTDFNEFRVTAIGGPAARNKGLALFPRRVGGRFVALGRHDGVNSSVMTSSDIRYWDDAVKIQEPERPWDLMYVGNCGSPIETDAGWLVMTHAVGPFRRYTISAILLDLDDPSRVIGRLDEPLISPTDGEREGYVPNVVYSCGSLVHGNHLVVPYGRADMGTSVAIVPVDDLLNRMAAPVSAIASS